MKKFWKKTEGFTLVELIVVIAILGILAGVGTVGYSGYVKKANMAADEALLNAVNNAFAVACVDNGANIYALNDTPILNLTDEKAVESVSVYDTEFQKYYGEDNESKFKTDYPVLFDNELGGFKLMVEGATLTKYYNGGKVTVTAEQIEKLKDSAFGNSDIGLGFNGLLDKVDMVATLVGGMDGNATYNNIINDETFKRSLLRSLGVENADTLPAGRQLNNAFATQLERMATMIAERDGVTTEEAKTKLNANMAVLYTAQNTNPDMNVDDVLYSNNPKEIILAAVVGDNISQAALYYGMYTAYAHSTGNETLIQKTNDPRNFFNSLSADNISAFQDYLDTEQGEKDLDAYMESMKVLNSAGNDKNVVEGVLTNNFNDQTLKDMFESMMRG